jgi:hypothetical protein
MNILQCSEQNGVAAWRTGDKKACFVFYLDRIAKEDNHWNGNGDCYVRNKVVPLHFFAPWLARPIGPAHPSQRVNLVNRDMAGLEAVQRSETYTPEYPFGDVEYH